MSKCWYCNNELTTGDSPKHFGICNKCYDEMFKSSDTIIRSFTNKIADLEAKLAESEEQLKEELVEKKGLERALSACNRQNDEFAEMIKKLVREKQELKEQLANQNQDQARKAYQEGLLQKQFDKDMEIQELKYKIEQLKQSQKQLAIEELRKLHAIKDDASDCITINGIKFSYEQMLIIDEVNNNYRMNIKKLNQQLKSQAEIVDNIKKRLARRREKMQNDTHSYPQTVVCWQDIVAILDQVKGENKDS